VHNTIKTRQHGLIFPPA